MRIHATAACCCSSSLCSYSSTAARHRRRLPVPGVHFDLMDLDEDSGFQQYVAVKLDWHVDLWHGEQVLPHGNGHL